MVRCPLVKTLDDRPDAAKTVGSRRSGGCATWVGGAGLDVAMTGDGCGTSAASCLGSGGPFTRWRGVAIGAGATGLGATGLGATGAGVAGVAVAVAARGAAATCTARTWSPVSRGPVESRLLGGNDPFHTIRGSSEPTNVTCTIQPKTAG